MPDLLGDLRDKLAETGAAPDLHAAPDIIARVRPLALKRALRNLIENALRYGREVEVSLDRAGDMARIVVADRGPGIPEGGLERLFDPFVRLETSRSRETGGVGLGLSIARTIVHAHGGDLGLANRPGGGLAATVHLPLSPVSPRRPDHRRRRS